MKSKFLMYVLALGWVFLAIFLTSGYFFNKLSSVSHSSLFSTVTWENHVKVFNGAIQCNLISDDLLERKSILKEQIFLKMRSREENSDGITYYFQDDTKLLESVMEHMLIEKACCPFFKFDLSILPFDGGFALRISGSEAALEIIKEFENSI